MKQTLLPLLAATALMGASSTAHAETWECAIIGATQKVILTQESDPALSDNRYVPGTVTGPYGKKHTAEVSIDGFDRRWDYATADKIGVYAVFMGPSGLAGFYDFSNPEEEAGTRLPEHLLSCEESKAKEKRKQQELNEKLKAEKSQPRLNSLREAYRLAIKQKIERNWRQPQDSGEMPECEVRVMQGPGGIILDVSFGACKGETTSYRLSIENAVYKAEPLPKPGDPSLFEHELIILFNPG